MAPALVINPVTFSLGQKQQCCCRHGPILPPHLHLPTVKQQNFFFLIKCSGIWKYILNRDLLYLGDSAQCVIECCGAACYQQAGMNCRWFDHMTLLCLPERCTKALICMFLDRAREKTTETRRTGPTHLLWGPESNPRPVSYEGCHLFVDVGLINNSIQLYLLPPCHYPDPSMQVKWIKEKITRVSHLNKLA